MTGIIGAMEVEIRHILAKMKDVQEKTIGGVLFHLGLLEDKPVVVARCGVGKVHAAHAVSVMTTHFDTARVINVGVAGGIAPEVGIGDVVIATGLVQHDVNVGDFGYPLGQVPGTDNPFFGACQDLTGMTKEIADKVLATTGNICHIGKMATGDQFIHDPATKEHIWSNFKVSCVEMEGAAMAQVCAITNVPFIAIRAISDKADGTAHEDFPAFVEATALVSSQILVELVKKT